MLSYQEILEEKGLMRIDDMPDIEHAKDHFNGLLDVIYKHKDINDLEWHLEEIGFVLGVELPKGEPQIRRPYTQEEESAKRLYQFQVGYTRAYAEFMKGVKNESNS